MPGEKDAPAQTPGAGAAAPADQRPGKSSSAERLGGGRPSSHPLGDARPDKEVRAEGARGEKATGAQLSGPTLPSPCPCSEPPASACQRPGRPCPHHQALKIVFFWTPKRGKNASPEKKLFGSVFPSPPHKKETQKGKGSARRQQGTRTQVRAALNGQSRADRGSGGKAARQRAGPRVADTAGGHGALRPAALGAGSAAGATGGGAAEAGGKVPGAGRGRDRLAGLT